MKLYYAPGRLLACRPTSCCASSALHVELKKVDTKARPIEGGGDYWKVNPKRLRAGARARQRLRC